jgi:hypothetical protein
MARMNPTTSSYRLVSVKFVASGLVSGQGRWLERARAAD